MKKSEKLFLIINKIDEDIVEEAKYNEETPVRMKPEPHTSIRGIIALAACIAVLAVGVFALVKFKLNNGGIEPSPIQSDSSEYSSDSSESSNSSESNGEYTAGDIELQGLLKELVPKAEEIDGMFNDLSPSGDKFIFRVGDPVRNENYLEMDYYLIPKDQRTANGLFAIPQSRDEMEHLVSQYFSTQAAEFYMSYVRPCIMAANADRTYTVELDSGAGFELDFARGFFEINGGMYFTPSPHEYHGMCIDCETARIIRQTDEIIIFTYQDYNYYADVYYQRNGVLVNEDGAWKLDYYPYNGFPLMPDEYTEQDLELQKILETLSPGNKVATTLLFNNAPAYGDTYYFILPGNRKLPYLKYIDVSGPQPSVNHPKSLAELEETLLEFFTEESAQYYMSLVGKGTMTDNGDGTYNVKSVGALNPVYIEIDGKMFYRTYFPNGDWGKFNYTAKVVEWTDDTITYTYVSVMSGGFGTESRTLKFERGGWKMNYS